MKHAMKQRWRKGVASVTALSNAGNMGTASGGGRQDTDAAADLIRRKETRSVVPRTGATECKLDGRTINVPGFHCMDAFTRQVVQLSGPVSTAKLIPTLP
jgi:hypothetical protein